jgi:hypothetical protein
MQDFSLHYNYWESILGRRLKDNEKRKFKNVKHEKAMNKVIENVYFLALKDGLYIPELTEKDGNCLFSSLCYHKLADNIHTLKRGLSNMMFLFKDMKNIIPGEDMSLVELFSNWNEAKFVFCNKEEKLYKYTYDTMCMDLLSDDGWQRISTELLLRVMSIILNVKFTIYYNTGYKTQIFYSDKENAKTQHVYLALLGESHYLPLDKISGETIPECLEYTDCRDEFIKWGKNIIIKNTKKNLNNNKNNNNNNSKQYNNANNDTHDDTNDNFNSDDEFTCDI